MRCDVIVHLTSTDTTLDASILSTHKLPAPQCPDASSRSSASIGMRKTRRPLVWRGVPSISSRRTRAARARSVRSKDLPCRHDDAGSHYCCAQGGSTSGGALRLVESAPCVQRGEHMRHPSRPMASAKERTNCWAQLAAVLGGTEGLEGGAGRE